MPVFSVVLTLLQMCTTGCTTRVTQASTSQATTLLSIQGPAALSPGQSVQLTTSPQLTTAQGLVWGIAYAGNTDVGAISPDGTYLAPANTTGTMAVTITASAPGYTQAVSSVTIAATAQQVSAAKTYYLDSIGGDDANAGTDSKHPWNSIGRLNQQTLNPGDTVLLHRGGVWHDTLQASNSGSAAGYITYADYGTGDLPRIDVSVPVSGWQPETEAGFTAYYTVLAVQPHIVTVDGGILWPNLVPTADLNLAFQPLAEVAAGGWSWDAVKSRLYVRMPDDSDPSQHAVLRGDAPFAFSVNGKSFVQVRNLDLEGAEYNCLRVAGGSSDIVISGNTLRFCGYNGNQAALFLDGASNMTVTGNTISYAMNTGIDVSGYAGSANDSVRLSNNILSYIGYDGIQVGPVLTGSITNVVVDHQAVSYCGQVRSDSSGIDAYFGGTGMVYAYNTVHDCGRGTRFATGLRFDSGTSDSLMYGNLAYHNSSGCVQLTGTGHSFFNNTCYQNNENPSYDYGEINLFISSETGAPSGMNIWNNVIWPSAGKSQWKLPDTPSMPITADHNVYVLNGSATAFGIGSTTYTFAAWQKIIGGDSHSPLTNDPVLRSPGTLDFTPLHGSPALGTGVATSRYTATILSLPVSPPPNVGSF